MGWQFPLTPAMTAASLPTTAASLPWMLNLCMWPPKPYLQQLLQLRWTTNLLAHPSSAHVFSPASAMAATSTRRHYHWCPNKGRHYLECPTAGRHYKECPTAGRHYQKCPTMGRHSQKCPSNGHTWDHCTATCNRDSAFRQHKLYEICQKLDTKRLAPCPLRMSRNLLRDQELS